MNNKYYLSGLAIVRDEEDYIEEWLRYHIEEMGFDHFFLYDDESKMPVRDYLQKINFKYFDKITIIDWSTSPSSQTDTHEDFLKRYRDDTKWVISFDPDEYIVLKSADKTLVQFLKDAENTIASIGIKWTYFGANGQVHKTEGTDIERFTKAVSFGDHDNKGKQFVQTEFIHHWVNHLPVISWSSCGDIYTEILTTDEQSTSFFQLNHYFTRSWDEWVKKIDRGSCVESFRRRLLEFFILNPDMEYLNDGKDKIQHYGHNYN